MLVQMALIYGIELFSCPNLKEQLYSSDGAEISLKMGVLLFKNYRIVCGLDFIVHTSLVLFICMMAMSPSICFNVYMYLYICLSFRIGRLNW